MIDRKALKADAKKNMKKHYWIFFLICFIAAFIGAEFASSLSMFSIKNPNVESIGSSATAVIDSVKSTSTKIGNSTDVIYQLIQGQLKKGEKESEKIVNENIKTNVDSVFGLKRGVFADMVNKTVSGGFYIMLFRMIRSLVSSDTANSVIFTVMFIIFQFFLLYFIKECYKVLTRRFFMEGRTYETFSTSSVKRHFSKKRWPKMAWTMFVKSVYEFLWSLTIVMYPVKTCAYAMVPYIMAENPNMKANEAITLSRKMMVDHKWEYFKIFLSLIPWYLLDALTAGILGIFFTNMYETAIISEYYVKLRDEAKEKGILNADRLNDVYLFEKPSEEIMKEYYAEVWELVDQPIPDVEVPAGFRGFLIKWFGITLFNTKKELEYEEREATLHYIERLKLIAEGKRYPGRLYPGTEKKEKINLKTPNYLRNYSLTSLVLMFFIFAFVGWAWEVSIHLVQDHAFVNRGVLHGPWLPIYGAGCVLILVILKRLRKNPALEFLSAIVLCGIVEYFTHYFLEITKGIKWWDYTGYFLNLNGRICAEGLLVFGVGGIAVVYFLAPFLDNKIRKIDNKIAIPICVTLLCVFIADQIYSSQYPNTGKGITDYEPVSQVESVCAENESLFEKNGEKQINILKL